MGISTSTLRPFLGSSPYVRFLKDNPSVKIHAPSATSARTRDLLALLGLSPTRLIQGDVRARVVYLPQGSACGQSSNPLTLQMFSNTYMNYMDGHFDPITQRAIVLIERTKSRRLKQHPEVASYLRQVAARNKLDFVVFSDKHLPPYEETRKLFRRAALVVAPHYLGPFAGTKALLNE